MLLKTGAYFAVSMRPVVKETPRSRSDVRSQCDARETGIDRVRRFRTMSAVLTSWLTLPESGARVGCNDYWSGGEA